MRSLVIRFLIVSLWGGAAALGAWAVCAVLRRCRAPSRMLCWLWLAVGLRFVLPKGIPLTLPRPRNEQLAEAAEAVEVLISPAAAPQPASVLPGAPVPAPETVSAASPWYQGVPVWHLLFGVWAVGVLVLFVHALWGYARLRRSIATACRADDGCFGGVPTPFTLGILRPRIYLPDALTGPAREAVRRHEQTHIRRGDTVTKPLFYAAACLHWFNPLAWMAFRQFERAMEAACDEAAVRGKSAQERNLYCESLLQFALRGSTVPGSLAFGQGAVRRRVGHLLRYRRLGTGALALCAAAVAVSATACMVRPTVAHAAPAAETAALPAGEETAPAATPSPAEPSLAPLPLTDMAGTFACPVPNYKSISHFMSDSHRGDDLCAPQGTDVVAAAGGTVLVAQFHYSYGNYVVIDHGTLADGHVWRSLYAHMADLAVEPGDPVAAGQIIGHVGSTGNSTGNHLHFELTRDGVLMQPRYFTAYQSEDTAVLSGALAAEMERSSSVRTPQQVWEELALLLPTSEANPAYLSQVDTLAFELARLMCRSDESTVRPQDAEAALAVAAQQLEEYLADITRSGEPAFGPALQNYSDLSTRFSRFDHDGLDFAAEEGTPVYAVGPGIVADTGYDTALGWYVRIAHDTSAAEVDCATLYAHLESPAVDAGQTVEQGQVIGYVGSTGQSTGSHLHLSLTINGVHADPALYISD